MASQAIEKQLAVERLYEELLDFSFKACGYNHHYNQANGSREGATCSKKVRDVRLLCAHPDQYGLKAPLALMHDLGFLTKEQLKEIDKFISNQHRMITMGDTVVDMLARRAFYPNNPHTEWKILLSQFGYSGGKLPDIAPHTRSEIPTIAKKLQSTLGSGLEKLRETMLLALEGSPHAGEQIFEMFITTQNVRARALLPTELFDTVMHMGIVDSC